MRARRRRLRRTRQARRRRANRIRTIAVIGLVGIGSAALVGAVAMNSVASNLEAKQSELKEIRLGQNTRVYDRFGKPLGYIAGTTNRTMVRSKRIPQTLKDATVAIEDKRFYEHHGVDYYRLFGATLRNVASNGPQQGGSTITMQLARNLIPGGATAARNIERKVEETYLALQYEKKYTKDEILTRYLNSVFYGNFALGVQAAALTYFDRDVSKINLVQAALLAGLPQAPSAYNPFVNPQAAKERRNQVLQEMADQGYIPQEQADRAKQSGLNLKRGNAYRGAQREEYFFEYVRQRLIASFGEREVEKGGFKVQTTIDPTLQTYAKEAINGQLGQSDDPAAAIVMVDSRKGFIRTMQSSVTFSAQNQFNFATQAKRQPGSTFKTFVLTRAIEQGINPYTTSYVSKPLKFTDPVWGPIDVKTYSGSYRGRTSISSATLSSDNSVYSQMTLDLGPDEIVDLAYRMGIPRARKLPVVPSIGLGSGEVTPLDMATAYSALSNGGLRITPVGVQKITASNGRNVPLHRPKRTRVFDDGVAYEVTKILHSNVTGGTGTSANIAPAIAGKTGTTDNYVDAWFVAYTPCFTTAVWMGYPNNTGTPRYMNSVHGISVAGGTFPARIWADFMKKVLANPNYKCAYSDFPAPQNPVSWQAFSSEFTRAADVVTTEASTEATTETTPTEPPNLQPLPDPTPVPGQSAPTPDPTPVPANPPEPTPVPEPTPQPEPTPAPTPAPEPTPTAPAP